MVRTLLRCAGLSLALLLLPQLDAQDKKPADAPPDKAPAAPDKDADKADKDAAKKDGDKKDGDKKDGDKKDGDKKDGDKPKDDPKGKGKEEPKGKTAKGKDAGKDKMAAKDQKEAYQKLVAGGEITGKLVHWDPNQKYFNVQVPIQYMVPNMGAINNLARLQAQMQFQPPRTPQDLFNLQQQMAREQANLYQVRTENKSVEFQCTDDFKVRIASPPVMFNDKGKPRPPTREELKELKGPNPKLPGYTGEITDIHTDAVVTVFLKARAPVRTATKGKDADKGAAGGAEMRHEAVMILIQADAAPKP